MTKAVFIQVGGGRVSLTSYVLLWSFTSWKLRSFWNKSSCCCSDNPAFSLVSKLPVLLKITRVTVLNKLSNNNDVIVKPADKRGATAILNTCDYIIEGKRQLSN